jgi:hypothetical protein
MEVVVVNRVAALYDSRCCGLVRTGARLFVYYLIALLSPNLQKQAASAVLRTSSVAQSRSHASLRSHPPVTSLLRRPASCSLGRKRRQQRRCAYAVVKKIQIAVGGVKLLILRASPIE